MAILVITFCLAVGFVVILVEHNSVKPYACLNSVGGKFFFRRCRIFSDDGAGPLEKQRTQERARFLTSVSQSSLTIVLRRCFVVNDGRTWTSCA